MAKYATAELNKVASRKTGEIEAQCKLDASIDSLENGAIVFIQAEDNTIVDTPSAKTIDAMYLHFSNPRRYEDGHTGMENYVYENNEGYLPRLYKLTVGDIFTTNFDYANEGGIVSEAPAVGTVFTFGDHKIVVIESSANETVPSMLVGATYRVIK
jgi:hypothetical protein